MEKYLDVGLSAKERARDLLSRMTVEEKMAQTYCLMPSGEDDEKVEKNCSFGLGAVSTLEVRLMKTKQEAASFQRTIQRKIMKQSRFHIPAIFHMEGLCGAFIQDATSFPSGIGRGASFDPELEEKVGAVVAKQERAVGITHTFAPVLDISRDSRMGRQGETYGEDPTLASAMGVAYTKGVQNGNTNGLHSEAVAKHFLGFHNSEGGIHGANCQSTKRLMNEVYGKPFQAAIREANLRGIMPCYNTCDGEALSVSKEMLTTLLRDEMGFDGIVAADYSAIANVHNSQRMYDSLAEAGFYSMKAGMDLEQPNRECFNEELEMQFKSGQIDSSILDDATLRVLEAKFRMGLFEHPFALPDEQIETIYDNEDDCKISLQAAEESLVLLKNDGVLPIAQTVKKIAIIGPHGDNARAFFGGYTHVSMVEAVYAVANSIAGIGEAANNQKKVVPMIPDTQIQSDETAEFDAVLNQIKPHCKSLYHALQAYLPDIEITYVRGYPIAGNDQSGFEEAFNLVQQSDLCILTLGGKHGSCSVASMGEGVDSTDINLPACQDAFIKAVAQLKKPLVGIHFNGRPISSDVADQYLNAIIEAWNPSEMGGEAIAKTLVGTVNPSGKMPVSTAYNAGQVPVYYNHYNGSSYHQGASIGFQTYVDLPHKPRYCFGHGLSYTTFSYSDLKLSTKNIQSNGNVTIQCRVKNTGTCAGTEVVQLYVRDEYASRVRPVLELAGFRRISLQPGEEKKVEFCLPASQLAFLDANYHWKIEQGTITVKIGASSEDIRLEDSFEITDNQWIEGKDRSFYA